MKQRNIGPVTKTTTAGAALVSLIVWVCEINGIEVPVEVASSAVILIVFLAGVLVPHSWTQDGKHEATRDPNTTTS